jgi:alkanesulfonate monooxygenase SsuD/methylene tetrahydromethanopterin reductase-like flavin-dependent oxidoreductase (luciferase family)
MNEARDRFDEAAGMVVRGLEEGFVEGDGPYYKQVRTEVRPRPIKSFADRFYMVAMSPDSVPVCAELGGQMMTFAQKPWDQMVDHFETYRRLYKEHQGKPAKPVVCVDFMACDESAEKAEALARKHMSAYYLTVVQHYEMMSDHFQDAKGYDTYAEASQVLREAGLEAIGNAFVDINTWGSPNEILEKLEERRRIIGDFDLTIQPSYGGMSEEDARSSMDLFAKKVLPELKSWGPAPQPKAEAAAE